MSDDTRMNRRGMLKALLGLAAVAAGVTTLAAPNVAEAAPLTPQPQATPDAETMAKDENLPASEPTQYYYRRRVYRRPVYRRRYVRPRYYYRRPVYRRRYVRRVYLF